MCNFYTFETKGHFFLRHKHICYRRYTGRTNYVRNSWANRFGLPSGKSHYPPRTFGSYLFLSKVEVRKVGETDGTHCCTVVVQCHSLLGNYLTLSPFFTVIRFIHFPFSHCQRHYAPMIVPCLSATGKPNGIETGGNRAMYCLLYEVTDLNIIE